MLVQLVHSPEVDSALLTDAVIDGSFRNWRRALPIARMAHDVGHRVHAAVEHVCRRKSGRRCHTFQKAWANGQISSFGETLATYRQGTTAFLWV